MHQPITGEKPVASMVRLSSDLLTRVIRTTRLGRRLAMEDAGYLRAQADRCLRLGKTVR